MNDFIIRKLGENDKELFVGMRMAYIWDSFDDVVDYQAEQIETNLRVYFDEHINKDDLVAMVLEIEGKPVSIALLVISKKPANPGFIDGRVGTLMNVYTIPEYRKRGLATVLLNELIKEAKMRQLSLINLLATDKAYRLYQKLGFQEDEDKAMEMKL